MTEQKFIDRVGYGDLKRPFPLLKELFEYAEKQGLDATGFDDFSGESRGDNSSAIEFPEKFNGLIPEHPGKYFIVAYDNRQDSYYKEGTRHRMVRLSNVRRRSETNERVREVDLKEVDPTFGNKAQIKVKESVNNKSFVDINTATGEEIEQPHGQAEYLYELDAQGAKTIKETRFNRLDEGLFRWKNQNQPVRWVRNLEVEKDAQNTSKMTYEDLYIIGRVEKAKSDERAMVKTYITGSVENPKSILVEIGIGAPASAKVLYEDKLKNIKVIAHEGINAYKEQLQILKQEPAYAALFQKPFNAKEFLIDITFKARMLQEDWDKPQAIFSQNARINASPKELSS